MRCYKSTDDAVHFSFNKTHNEIIESLSMPRNVLKINLS